MNIQLAGHMFRDSTAREPAGRAQISAFEESLGIRIPQDYRDLLEITDGVEGFVEDTYFSFIPCQEVLPFTADYEVDIYCPGHVFVGSNGGGRAFLLRISDGGDGHDVWTDLPFDQFPEAPENRRTVIHGASLPEFIARIVQRAKDDEKLLG